MVVNAQCTSFFVAVFLLSSENVARPDLGLTASVLSFVHSCRSPNPRVDTSRHKLLSHSSLPSNFPICTASSPREQPPAGRAWPIPRTQLLPPRWLRWAFGPIYPPSRELLFTYSQALLMPTVPESTSPQVKTAFETSPASPGRVWTMEMSLLVWRLYWNSEKLLERPFPTSLRSPPTRASK